MKSLPLSNSRPLICLLLVLLSGSLCDFARGTSPEEKNKFRQREASDDALGYPERDEDSLLNTQCPKNLDLRWQTEVSSSIFATPLITDINGDGKLDIVVPSFVHLLEVLEGADGDKMPGWPAFHHSTTYSSPLLYDIDKDGVREIALATYNGQVLFFRVSGFLMNEKLEVPRRNVKKNWYVGLNPDPVDRSHPDVHDDQLVTEAIEKKSELQTNGSAASTLRGMNISVAGSIINNTVVLDPHAPHFDHKKEVNVPGTNSTLSEVVDDRNSTMPGTGGVDNKMEGSVPGTNSNLSQVVGDRNSTMFRTGGVNYASIVRRILEDNSMNGSQERDASSVHAATVENEEGLDADADSSFELFRGGDDVGEDYSYDYDDYGDEDAWGEEGWAEVQHEKLEDYVDIDSHILCTPVIADIDKDGVMEMVVAVSHFFDPEYYEKQEHLKELGGIDISKYVAGSIVVFNLDTKQVKWTKDLDISTSTSNYKAYIYSSPTVADLDGDGYLDILVGTSFGLFYVLDHHGRVRDNFPLAMAEIQGSVVASDINDDGKLELVTTDSHGNVAAWNTQGKEIWETHLKSFIPQGPTIGDVDGDGRTEVVVPTIAGKIYVLSGKDGSVVRPYPFTTHGRVMNQVLLVDLNKRGSNAKGLTLVTTSFDGYLYLIDGPTSCADVVDIGETAYSMVLADNVDGGDDLDLVVTTMNGNVFCFSTPAAYHPLKSWRSLNHGRNSAAYGFNRQGVYVTPSSRAFRDEEGKNFWVEIEIVDKHRHPSGYHAPYNVNITLLVPGNYQGERSIRQNQVFSVPGKYKIKLPTVGVRTAGTVVVEMVDKNGIHFSDEFSLTFHMYYYKLLKWMIALPMLGMFGVLVILRPQEAMPLPSFSRNTNL